MGQQICNFNNLEQPLWFKPIKIQKNNFDKIQNGQQIIQTCISLSNHQIPNNIKHKNCYKDHFNTYYFIGNLHHKFAENYGVYFIPQKILYYGNFLNGQMSGQGFLKFIHNHITYQGQFLQGAPNGKGIYNDYIKKFTYDGTWKKNIIKGFSIPVEGILKFHNHQSIKQIQFQSFQHKLAVIKYKNESKYYGFINDQLIPNGNGKIQFPSKNTYQGQWLDGKFHGFGTYTWKTGELYKGEYLNGQKNGDGTFYYPSGKCFKGLWKNGKRQGFGKLINQKGLVIQKGVYTKDNFDLEKTKIYLDSQMQRFPFGQVKSQLIEQEIQQKQLQKKLSTQKAKAQQYIENLFNKSPQI